MKKARPFITAATQHSTQTAETVVNCLYGVFLQFCMLLSGVGSLMVNLCGYLNWVDPSTPREHVLFYFQAVVL